MIGIENLYKYQIIMIYMIDLVPQMPIHIKASICYIMENYLFFLSTIF